MGQAGLARLGVVVGWGLERLLGQSLGRREALRVVRGIIDGTWGSTGGSWRRPGVVLEVVEASSSGPGGPWTCRGPALGGPGSVSGRFWRVLEAVRGEVLGSWRLLVWPWGLWEASWDGPAGFWRSPGAFLGGLRSFLGVFEATWGWFDGVLEAS